MIIEGIDPPDDSRISVERIGEELYITIPYEHLLIEKLGYASVPIAIFCVITIGTVSYGWELFLSEYWDWMSLLRLGLSTLLCMVAFPLLIKMFGMYSPQRLSLLQRSLLFDNGLSPLMKKSIETKILLDDARLKGDERISLSLNDIRTISLESNLLENKLFVHESGVKLEIAPTATHVEKRWLLNFIKSFYQID